MKKINQINTIVFLLFFLIFLSINAFAGKKVIGYYPSWYKYSFPASSINYEYLTHINHAFAWPDASGNLITDGNIYNPQLIQLAHSQNVKVSLSLGGWGNSAGFSPMTADSNKRKIFIDNLVNYLNNIGYDGVDLDWEYPSSDIDKNNLNLFVKELREKFNTINPEWLITFAVGTSNYKGQWYDYSFLIPYVDWFNAMCYDYHGSWSAHIGHNAALYQPPGDNCGAVNIGMNYLHLTRGIPKNKLTVGIPFYGKEFNGTDLYGATGQATDRLYKEIAPLINNGWVYHWDNIASVPYLKNSINTKIITFDDSSSVASKCEWIKSQNYSGGMIWALGQDKYNSQQILLKTMGFQLLDSIPSSLENNTFSPSEFILHKNYPNPFNPSTIISFTMPSYGKVNLAVYNSLGQLVKEILNENKSEGTYNYPFDGSMLTSGVYIYRILIETKRGQQSYSGKMILLK